MMLKWISIAALLISSPLSYAQTATTAGMSADEVVLSTNDANTLTGWANISGATGTITFYNNGTTSLGSCTAANMNVDVVNTGSAAGGVAAVSGCSVTLATMAAGTYSLTATYSGDATYAGSTSSAYTVIVSAAVASPTLTDAAKMSLGINASLNGFVPSPNDAWHQPVDSLPVDPNSATIIANIGATHLHTNFGSTASGYGIPYDVVDGSTIPFVAWKPDEYTTDSDITLAPIPPDVPIESAPPNCEGTNTNDDHHVLILDRNAAALYEWWHFSKYVSTDTACSPAPGKAGQTEDEAANGNMWDMLTTEQRPLNLTSVDVAGLSVFEGLIRYDEIQAGVINHAIRYTTNLVRASTGGNAAFEAPATHGAPGANSGSLNTLGMRLRLKASFDISTYSATNQIILKAMKKYGIILADIGGTLFFEGSPSPNWDDNDLTNLNGIAASDFEAVEQPTVYAENRYPKGTAAAITSFTASPSTVILGRPVTLTLNTTNTSYEYIDKLGLVRGTTVTFVPLSDTYTLTVSNRYLANDDGFGDGNRNTQTIHLTVQAPVFQGGGVQGGAIK